MPLRRDRVNGCLIPLAAALGLLLAFVAGLYVLALLSGPPQWRDSSPGEMTGQANEYSEEIAELRIYRLPDRGFDFYFQDELTNVQPLFRTSETATIVRILNATREDTGEPGGPYCGRDINSKQAYHFITYRGDGSVFGYTIIDRTRVNVDAPARIKDCATMNYYYDWNHAVWDIHNLFTTLDGFGVDLVSRPAVAPS
jgi:hypothetical protein